MCKDFGRMFNNSIPTSAFFFKVEISLHTLILLFTPKLVHSGSVSCDDCGQVFPDELPVSSFPDRFPYYDWAAAQSPHSYFVGSRVYRHLGVTCHLHFWQNDCALLRATSVTRGWNEHRKESAHKVNSGEENFPPAPAGIRTRNLSIASPALLPTS